MCASALWRIKRWTSSSSMLLRGFLPWFSSPPTPPLSPPRPIPIIVHTPAMPTSPAQQRQVSTSETPSGNSSNLCTPSLPSSIDDRVPSLPPTPPVNPASSSKQSPSPQVEHIVTLNPASSRFTLSIPILGRAKVQLESVLGVGDGSSTGQASVAEYNL
ncbi:hypothetical protein BDZ97DRAFT_1113095 [Flammula alnicola]|nr:hypothetical protein BDZ97DRAFT_1113095 [Flammula alnicola]